ncbi:MAG: hypothetical protein QXK24_08530 [Ignisphaera sp.]|uniref:Uncharacterized protein n=1 Tax=Ignisphaera aggregans TaxID=334771 RepID=A0A7J3I8H2_9CREN
MIPRRIKNIALGFVEGVAYYTLYVILLPRFFSVVLKVPMLLIDPLKTIFILCIFIVFGIVASSVKAPVGVVFVSLQSLLGIGLLLSIAGVGVIELPLGGSGLSVAFEFGPVLRLVVSFAVVFTIVRVFEKIIKFEE